MIELSFSEDGRDAASRWFGPVLGASVALVVATILLGVATKATGAGLACDANWPLCDGGLLNLFPATVPSFFEWIHRVVAMVAGFAIVGSAVLAIRAPRVDRRIVGLVVAGAVLLPVQVYLGRETVLQYEMAILSAHFWTAILIYLLFVLAGALTVRWRLTGRQAQACLAAVILAVPGHVAVSPLFIATYTPTIQTVQYGLSLLVLGGLVVAAVYGWSHRDRSTASTDPGSNPVEHSSDPARRLGASALWALMVPVGIALVLFGRQTTMAIGGTVESLYLVSALAVGGLALLGIALVAR